MSSYCIIFKKDLEKLGKKVMKEFYSLVHDKYMLTFPEIKLKRKYYNSIILKNYLEYSLEKLEKDYILNSLKTTKSESKDETIESKDETIESKDETIESKDETIESKDEIIGLEDEILEQENDFLNVKNLLSKLNVLKLPEEIENLYPKVVEIYKSDTPEQKTLKKYITKLKVEIEKETLDLDFIEKCIDQIECRVKVDKQIDMELNEDFWYLKKAFINLYSVFHYDHSYLDLSNSMNRMFSSMNSMFSSMNGMFR